VLLDFFKQMNVLATSTLVAAGHYRRDGWWKGPDMAGIPQLKPDDSYTQEVQRLLLRAQEGDASVLPELHDVLENRPELWKQLGDLVAHCEEAVLGLAAGKSLLAKESIRKRMDGLKNELAGPKPSPLEKLLVDRVVLCWAQMHLGDLDAIQRSQAGQPHRVDVERRLAGLQARYLAAIKQLAVVRKLVLPTPTALDLLRYPLDETDGKANSRNTGTRPAKMQVSVAN
jgi:hypothetical protein